MYLHRKSEESSVTSVDCYWKKPKLSGIGTSIKFMNTKDLFPPKNVKKQTINKIEVTKLFEDVIELGRKNNINCQLGQYNYYLSVISNLSIHRLMSDFRTQHKINTGNGHIYFKIFKI